MYDVTQSVYTELVTEFVNRINGVFILAGAFCHVDTSSTPIPSGTIPAIINSSGFSYNTSVSTISLPSVGSVTEDTMIINFTFYKKYDSSLPEDISGKIYKENDRFYLYIDNTTPILEFIGHDNLLLRLTDITPFTVEVLRETLLKVRAMLSLQALDKLHDVINIPSSDNEINNLIDKMKQYIKYFVDKSFLFDLCIKSSTSIKDKILLSLSIRKPDGSLAKKDLITIELYARNYEPAIVLSTYFENDNIRAQPSFIFLDDTTQPFKIKKMISVAESSKFIKGIIRIVSELDTYRYVIKS